MDGLLVIDKPEGITSHDVVARVRRIFKTKRVGHTGTLDPFATGVVVVLIGRATRLAQFLDKDTKEYIASVKFGFETDTGDRTGSPKFQVPSSKFVSIGEIESVLTKFRGEIEQTPPMYSAKKVEGKKLYELARKGIEVERKVATVSIYELEIVDDSRDESEPPAVPGGLTRTTSTINFRVVCSAGTYIRTLAEDIGRRLGIGAHLTELRRTAAGAFRIDEAHTLKSLEALDDPTVVLRSIREAISGLSAFELPDDRVAKTKSGMSTKERSGRFADGESVQMIDQAGELIAIGRFDKTENAVQPKIVLV